MTKTAADIVRAFQELLAEEREAIRALDGPAVDRLTDRKLALAEALRACAPAAKDGEALRALMNDLRRNAVLLAHARDALRGAIEAMEQERGASRSWTV